MDIILHHYPLSPFSEKVRSMLGFTQTSWSSCLTSEAPPRGDLDLLTGGYSRIPVAQLGADIFCDSNLIAAELSTLANQDKLSLEQLSASETEQLRWLERQLFFACINKAFSLGLLVRIAKDKGVLNLGRFLKDRIQMGAKANISLGSPRSAPKHIAQGIQMMNTALNAHDFIGGDAPNLLDFAAYHCFWFLAEVGQNKTLDNQPKILAWYRQMKAFSLPAHQSISLEDAIQLARTHTPRDIAPSLLNDHRIGSAITIAPNDYRQIPVQGTLVGSGPNRWIVRIEQAETGPVHLHFPSHAVDVTIRLA